jgi:hypothetical protein
VSAIYRITKTGPGRSGGINRPFEARVGGLAKSNDECPYTIANEIIAERLGQVLGLPVPAGVLSQDENRKLHYLSLNVGQEGRELPPVIPVEFCAEDAWWAAGVLVFDVLIANGDRHRKNLSRDTTFPNEPPRVSVFDHGHALLGTDPPIGPERLGLAVDHLGCIEDPVAIARDTCLRNEDLNPDFIGAWVARVEQIPRFVIDDVCDEVAGTPGLNVGKDEAAELANWLARRVSRLGEIIWQNRDSFPNVGWNLIPPGGASWSAT